MFCPKCGAELPEDAKFCMKCGAKRPQNQPNVEQSTTPLQDQGKNQENAEGSKVEQGAVQQPQQRKAVCEMTEEELLADGKTRIKRAVRNVVIGLVGFCLILLVVRLLLPEREIVIDANSLPSDQSSSESTSSEPTSVPVTPEVTDTQTEGDRYTISYESGEVFAEAAGANETRYIALHEGETIRINRIEVSGIEGYAAYNYDLGYGFLYMDFRNDSDLYSINEGDFITIDAVVSGDMFGELRLIDCVLIDVEDNEYGYIDDVMSSEYGTHSKMDGSSTIGFSVYTGEGSGFILTYYGADSTASNMIFSISTPYSNSSSNDTVIRFYDSVGNSLVLTVVTPGTISISCDGSTFEGVSANSLDGTYYMTESYINPAA